MPRYNNDNPGKCCIKELPGKILVKRWVVVGFEIAPEFWLKGDNANPSVWIGHMRGKHFVEKEAAEQAAEMYYPAWQAQAVEIWVYEDSPKDAPGA